MSVRRVLLLGAVTVALHGRGAAKVYGELREKAKEDTLVYPGTDVKFDFHDMTTQLYFSLTNLADWRHLGQELKRFRDGVGAVSASARKAPEPVNRSAPSIWCGDWRLPSPHLCGEAPKKGLSCPSVEQPRSLFPMSSLSR
ncbi:hypothetical protein [Amycolatopsis sp. cmx-11-12]|uniref:hypothetical protein n=1 Tax=Amycolatopsis sp. cmx-11-12 TaxID=2785795 RepID=UPI003917D727